MAVCGQDPIDGASVGEGDDRVGVIGRIDNDAIASCLVRDQIDVVVDRSNDDARDCEPCSRE
jgi:hypothetical protein